MCCWGRVLDSQVGPQAPKVLHRRHVNADMERQVLQEMWIQAAVLVQEPPKSCTGSTSAKVRWPPQRHVLLGMWLLADRSVQEPPKILQVGRMGNTCDPSSLSEDALPPCKHQTCSCDSGICTAGYGRRLAVRLELPTTGKQHLGAGRLQLVLHEGRFVRSSRCDQGHCTGAGRWVRWCRQLLAASRGSGAQSGAWWKGPRLPGWHILWDFHHPGVAPGGPGTKPLQQETCLLCTGNHQQGSTWDRNRSWAQ